jgi:hypothetical protein
MSHDNHNRVYLARIEQEKMLRAAVIQPQQQQINPAMAFFLPCYFQTLQTLLARRDDLDDNQAIVNEAWEIARLAFAKLNFEYVPVLGCKLMEGGPVL